MIESYTMQTKNKPYDTRIKKKAQNLRTNSTRHENHLWYDFLRDFHPGFTRQRIIGSYIIDFYCGKAKLAVELDGSQHFEQSAMDYDKEREKFLNTFGIKILRFSNLDIDNNFVGVCESIREMVNYIIVNK